MAFAAAKGTAYGAVRRTLLAATCLAAIAATSLQCWHPAMAGPIQPKLGSSWIIGAAMVPGMFATPQHPFDVRAAAGDGISEIRVFVGVLSRSSNSVRRETIRSTWGADKKIAKLMFFSLRPPSAAAFLALRQEAVAFGDIFITSEVYEDYYNITYAVLDIFKAAAVHGRNAFTHVIKTDDDAYMRLHFVMPALQSMPRSWLYTGTPMRCGRPKRTAGGRHVPYSNWPRDDRVRYGYGAGYALSMDLVMEIAAGAAHVIMPAHKLMMLEDLSVGYWVNHIGKEKGVKINYNNNLTVSRVCTPEVMFFHMNNQTTDPGVIMQCMHVHGGNCC